MLRLYDTATRQVRELAMREPGIVSIYLCGPTVYGPPHLGHGRATLVYDVLRRYLESTGIAVRLVSNITDIDDRIIERANREQRPWEEITHRCENVWFEAMERLNVARPTDVPHATEYVDEMVEMIGQLVEIGRAYTTDDGVYLSVETVEDYGLLAGQRLNDMLEGGGDREVFGADNKRHPADFVLWKLAKPGEPSWPSPWGDGRPGWHSECVVMSLDLLGEGFDLHCGGMDLKFPHHENERAQAVALGKRFANHWMHNGFVVDAEGEKMSKSIGNVANLLDLTEHYDPRAYRMLLLQSHYRSPVADRPGQHRRLGQGARRPGRLRRQGVGDRARRSRRRRRGRVPRADGRRPRHAGRDRAAVRHRPPGQRRDRRRRPRRRCAPRRGPAHLRRARAGARRRRRRPARGAGQGRRARRGARRQGLRHRRPRSAPSCRPTAGPWRRRSRARRCAADRGVADHPALATGAEWGVRPCVR